MVNFDTFSHIYIIVCRLFLNYWVTLQPLKINNSFMSIKISLKKGLDLDILGGVSDLTLTAVAPSTVAIVPDDYPGFTPKPAVKEGDRVESGQPLLYDKFNQQIKLVSPAAGTVKAVVRGERRKIERVVVEIDSHAKEPSAAKPSAGNADDARALLMESGLWAMMRQRPYDIVPDPDAKPRDIFVTGFDSAPLAAPSTVYLAGKERELAAGVELLSKLTEGKVYVSRHDGEALKDIPGAEMVDVSGPHPAGNASVLIANVAPVNKGETVWCLDIVTLARIGATVMTGKTPADTIVAVTGSEVEHPRLVSTLIGAELSALLAGNLKKETHHVRIISGNPLTGHRASMDGYLRYPYTQITVIPEGDDVAEFMGWAALSPKKSSVSRSFPGHFLRHKLNPDARLMGGRRAMIMSGEYDKVIPMDIMAEYLIKAIIARDIDRMEALGIYEVAPEDFALAEYVDTSKLPLQQIVRDGLDYLRKELK